MPRACAVIALGASQSFASARDLPSLSSEASSAFVHINITTHHSIVMRQKTQEKLMRRPTHPRPKIATMTAMKCITIDELSPELDDAMGTSTDDEQPVPMDAIVVSSDKEDPPPATSKRKPAAARVPSIIYISSDEEDPAPATSKRKPAAARAPSIIYISSDEEEPAPAATSETKTAATSETKTAAFTDAPAATSEARAAAAMDDGRDMLTF
ncbi:predicted protein [Postia placenta Mad-698-R]|nr:predicted protein [Postia placenta Mad-698-R]